MAPRIVIIDNYDSYAWNLYQAFGELTGTCAQVVRNDAVDAAGLEALAPTHLVLSPGPGNPEQPERLGVGRGVLLELGDRIPVLGVCLGHQGIGAVFGARVGRAPVPMHGKTSRIRHQGSPLFEKVGSPFEAMRYHSLVIDPASLPPSLKAIAWTEDGEVIMGVAHREKPIVGVQFHPESIGTPEGSRILSNFLRAEGALTRF
jgi:anthranilate synthase/aminodeoxychorismate synthase-like glutamine amidotransferase